jgi:hypothetical protein
MEEHGTMTRQGVTPARMAALRQRTKAALLRAQLLRALAQELMDDAREFREERHGIRREEPIRSPGYPA